MSVMTNIFYMWTVKVWTTSLLVILELFKVSESYKFHIATHPTMVWVVALLNTYKGLHIGNQQQLADW